MTDAQILLNLPPDTLTVLVLGYLGYRLAYTGKDASHSAVDVVFLSLVFTLAAKVGLALADLAHPGIGIAAAPVAVLAAAVLWRKWGELAVFKILRRLQVSHSDRHQTAWETIMLRSGAMPSQLIVRKKDGTSLMSERLADFAGELFGPCIFGSDGSIALYVTHFKALAGDWEQTGAAAAPDWGRLITYIAAAEIGEIEVRMAS